MKVETKQDRIKHFHDKCRLPNTRSRTVSKVRGHGCTLGPNFFRPNNQTAISSFVSSFRTLSTPLKNPHTTPNRTTPAANGADGLIMNSVMLVRASGILCFGLWRGAGFHEFTAEITSHHGRNAMLRANTN